MWIGAYDGTAWSAWKSFTLTTVPNTPPLATINDHSVAANQWSQVTSWITYSDAENNAATQYQFRDAGTDASSGYFSTASNAHWAANTDITVAATDLQSVWIRGGQAPAPKPCRCAPSTAPTGAVGFIHVQHAVQHPAGRHHRRSQPAHQRMVAGHKLDSYLDADDNAATQYQFWDSGTASSSGYFWTPDNPHQAAKRSSRSLPPISTMYGCAAAQPGAPRRCGSALMMAPIGAPGTQFTLTTWQHAAAGHH